MGMSPGEFWEMTPHQFFLKQKGFSQREGRAALYFREAQALQININRDEKSPPVDGTDILLLPGEKKKRSDRPVKKRIVLTLDEIARIEQLYNQPTTETILHGGSG